MKNQHIVLIGKLAFLISFLLGNICLFGYIITKNSEFAASGFSLLIFASAVNISIVIGLLIYGLVIKSKLEACLKAMGIILINIPIAYAYMLIGMNIISI